jgi:hypothetical protein
MKLSHFNEFAAVSRQLGMCADCGNLTAWGVSRFGRAPLALVGNPEEPIEFAEFHFESGS